MPSFASHDFKVEITKEFFRRFSASPSTLTPPIDFLHPLHLVDNKHDHLFSLFKIQAVEVQLLEALPPADFISDVHTLLLHAPEAHLRLPTMVEQAIRLGMVLLVPSGLAVLTAEVVHLLEVPHLGPELLETTIEVLDVHPLQLFKLGLLKPEIGVVVLGVERSPDFNEIRVPDTLVRQLCPRSVVFRELGWLGFRFWVVLLMRNSRVWCRFWPSCV